MLARAGKPRTVADFVVLDFRDVDQDFRGGVVERDGFEDGGAVVGDGNLSRRRRVEDLVHALGSEGRLDEVSESEGADERRETGLAGGRRGLAGANDLYRGDYLHSLRVLELPEFEWLPGADEVNKVSVALL